MASDKITFDGFERLSSNVYFLDRASSKDKAVSTNGSTTSDSRQPQPDLVIIGSWMGAQPRHISKYIAGYRVLFPGSSLLLIRNSVADLTLTSASTTSKRLEPALAVLERTISAHGSITGVKAPSDPPSTPSGSISATAATSSSHQPSILLHIFSNGGANQARALAQLWRAKRHAPLPISAMLLDSCPGSESYSTALAAFRAALPRTLLWPLRVLLLGIIHAAIMIYWVRNRLPGVVPFLQQLRRNLNDARLFRLGAPRTYVYSRTDLMVWWEDVASHAVEARRLGWKVETDQFQDSVHVGHMMADSDRYWGQVKKLA